MQFSSPPLRSRALCRGRLGRGPGRQLASVAVGQRVVVPAGTSRRHCLRRGSSLVGAVLDRRSHHPQRSNPGFAFRPERPRTARVSSSTGSRGSSTARRRSGCSRWPTQPSRCWCCWLGGAFRRAVVRARAATPNPSLERTATGMALGPRGYSGHHPPRGPSTTPAPASQLKR